MQEAEVAASEDPLRRIPAAPPNSAHPPPRSAAVNPSSPPTHLSSSSVPASPSSPPSLSSDSDRTPSAPLQMLLLQEQALRLEFAEAVSARHGISVAAMHAILNDEPTSADESEGSDSDLSDSDDEREFEAFVQQTLQHQSKPEPATVAASSIPAATHSPKWTRMPPPVISLPSEQAAAVAASAPPSASSAIAAVHPAPSALASTFSSSSPHASAALSAPHFSASSSGVSSPGSAGSESSRSSSRSSSVIHADSRVHANLDSLLDWRSSTAAASAELRDERQRLIHAAHELATRAADAATARRRH